MSQNSLAKLGAKIGAILGSMTLLVVIEPDIHIKGTFEIDLGDQHTEIEVMQTESAPINLRFE